MRWWRIKAVVHLHRVFLATHGRSGYLASVELHHTQVGAIRLLVSWLISLSRRFLRSWLDILHIKKMESSSKYDRPYNRSFLIPFSNVSFASFQILYQGVWIEGQRQGFWNWVLSVRGWLSLQGFAVFVVEPQTPHDLLRRHILSIVFILLLYS